MVEVSFFCSPIGLGHASRDIAIAQNFQKFSPNFISGLGAVKLFSESGFNVKDVYRPPNFIVDRGTLKSPLKWLWKYYMYYKECKVISSKIIKKNFSKFVVSDEDFASLSIAQSQKIPTVLITDILETRFAKGIGSFMEKTMNRTMKKIIGNSKVVIIPEKGDSKDNIFRVGPIVRKTDSPREELREKFGFDKKTILISIGGTDAGKFLIEKTLEVIPKLNEDVKVVLVSGPSLQKKFDKVQNFGFVNNLNEFIYASDLIITLAGKSTIDEANEYGTPGIFIPIKDHFEQEDNAREEGFGFEDIFRLDSLIPEKLHQSRKPHKSDGAKKASEIIESVYSSF